MNIWTVHATLADEVRPTQAIYGDEKGACAYAAALSRDEGLLAVSVVRFALDKLGTRANVAMFVTGERQTLPYVSDCRNIHGGGRKHRQAVDLAVNDLPARSGRCARR
jgi:hypothetical protein